MGAILDISSHWFQMYSSLLLKQHHKSKERNVGENILIRLYYNNYLMFGYCCIATEFTYLLLYSLNHVKGSRLCWICLKVCIAGFIIKQMINVLQLGSACY